MLYFHTAAHAPAAEMGLDALDPRLGIAWPEPIACRSPRDQAHRPIDAGLRGVRP
jgi:dTDP-4-dehydrorhamnose 3,5-epimerase